MILQQGAEGSPELLNLYCSAEYFYDRNMGDSLVHTLTVISEHDDTSLADVAFLDLGKFSLSQQDTAQALHFLNEVNQRYPKSYFAPHAEKLRADVYFNTPERREQALAMYRALLKEHGGYPFAATIRTILQEVEGEDFESDSGKKKKAPSDA
jgi:predicted negative regulator of RcsB-dependent stress response